jgi:hypothetical protein
MEKLDLVIKAISEAIQITPEGCDVIVYISSDNGLDAINPKEIENILIKLQDDDKILTINSQEHQEQEEGFILAYLEYYGKAPTPQEINQWKSAKNKNLSSLYVPSMRYFSISFNDGFHSWCKKYWSQRRKSTKRNNLIKTFVKKIFGEAKDIVTTIIAKFMAEKTK